VREDEERLPNSRSAVEPVRHICGMIWGRSRADGIVREEKT
jgi:hypothetical protein